MAETANKVLFNIKNVHIAKVTGEEGGKLTYDTPFKVPGARGWSPEPQGESAVWYADGIIYFRQDVNQGYQGDLVIAMTPEQFLTEILGRIKDKNGAIFENINDKQSRFAFMFESDGDVKSRRYVYHDCTATRPSREHSTIEESIEPGEDTITVTCAPRSTDGAIGAYLEPNETNQEIYNKFFEKVYEKDQAGDV